MKVITIWQPYATMLAIQAKKHETRSWYTSYRGPIAIHAAKKMNEELACSIRTSMILFAKHKFADRVDPLLAPLMHLSWGDSLGRILAVGRLNDCVPADLPETFDTLDRELGWFGKDRWAWRIGDVRLVKPYLIRGQQGLWELPKDVILE